MSRRFKRIVKVTLATRPSTRKGFFDRYTRATEITGNRVRFMVDKTPEKKSNKAKIYIYNLSAETRAEFQSVPAHIHLEAGYEGVGLSTVYKGDIYFAHSRPEGTEWVTTVECGSGLNAQRFARSSFSIKAGGSNLDAIKRLAKDVGLPVPTSISGARDFFGQVRSGKIVQGSSMKAMNRIVGVKGMTASIQDDKLVIVDEDGTRRLKAIKISQETGMLGVPEFGAPQKKGKPPTLTAKTLLASDIQVAGIVVVESVSLKVEARVQRVSHTGDTHGQDWHTSIEATVRRT